MRDYEIIIQRLRRLNKQEQQAAMSFLAGQLGDQNPIIQAHMDGSTQAHDFFMYLIAEKETRQRAVDKASQGLLKALLYEELYRNQIFESLNVRDSLFWLDTLKTWKQKYNLAAETAISESRALARQIPLAKDEYAMLENMLKGNASAISDAVTLATGELDGGAALLALCSVGNPELHAEIIRTAEEISILSLTEGTKLSPGWMIIVLFVYKRAYPKNKSIRQRLLVCLKDLEQRSPYTLAGQPVHDALQIFQAARYDFHARAYDRTQDPGSHEQLRVFEKELDEQRRHYDKWYVLKGGQNELQTK